METVPVTIHKATSNLRKKHFDADLAFADETFFQDNAMLFKPQSMFVVLIDDKAKVPLRITASIYQA